MIQRQMIIYDYIYDANELLGNYVTCIFSMYYSMSLHKITNLNSLETLHGFGLNCVLMFLGLAPTKIVKTPILIEKLLTMCILCQILKELII